MYDVSHKKEKLSMCMYDVIVKKAKIMRQKHKNMFESAVLIVKRAKTRANARGARCMRRTRRTRLAESSETADFNKYSNLISPRESYIYMDIGVENERKINNFKAYN